MVKGYLCVYVYYCLNILLNIKLKSLTNYETETLNLHNYLHDIFIIDIYYMQIHLFI